MKIVRYIMKKIRILFVRLDGLMYDNLHINKTMTVRLY
jgi:hypothetical protein